MSASGAADPRPADARRGALRAAFVLALAVLAGCGVVSLWSLARTQSDAVAVSRAREVLARLTDLRLAVDAAENGRLGYAMTGDAAERALWRRSRDAAAPLVGAIASLTAANPAQGADVGVLRTRVSEWSAALDEAVAAVERQGFRREEQARFTDRVRSAETAIREALGRMETRENALLDARRRAQTASTRRTRNVIVAADVFGILLLAGAGLVAAKDSRARLEAERALREREELFRLLVEGIAEYAIFLLDPAGRVVTWTGSAQRLKGYAAEEIIGRSHAIFYPPEIAESARPKELLEIALRDGRAEEEGWRVRKDGSRFWADVVITPIRSGGTLVGFAKVTRDMTEKREAARRIEELNESLRRRAAELAAANEELESFSYSVSHDLRAPIRSIDGFGQALAEDAGPALSDAARRDLERIRAAARRMGELIDALLELSRVGRRPLRRATVDLSALATTIAEELRRSEPDRRVAFDIAPGAVADGDETLLRLVLQNLIGNAWKFTAKKTEARIAFGVEDGAERAFFVSDNGAGFDMRWAGQLFAPFQRLHDGTDFPGTGVGLATVARIVQRHGGRVWAKGEVDEGATFYFTL